MVWTGESKILKCCIVLLITFSSLAICGHRKKQELIYVLEWTSATNEPFASIKPKRQSVLSKNCIDQNCYFTSNRDHFDDVRGYNAILFNIMNLYLDMGPVPYERADNQIYVAVGTEPAANHPQDTDFDMFFNLTWTYKLNSDVPFPFMSIRNNNSDLIGPKANGTHWMNFTEMKPVNKYIKRKLRNKKTAAAWFVSNCYANKERIDFGQNLTQELAKYGQTLDIYGTCGNKTCPKDQMDECFALIESDYYFYLAFESSFSEDYVTEKILTALQHFAVPVVFGGANYTKFMPNGTYLDARALGPAKLAKEMNDIIKDKNRYYDFFRWRRYYRYDASSDNADSDGICALCTALNKASRSDERRVYARFREWWNELQDGGTHANPIAKLPPKARDAVNYRPTEVAETHIPGMTPPPTLLQSFTQFLGNIYSYYFEIQT
ncbi:alpha-(1,3)-fucosyltransferase C-like [Hyposmocoma kahamanoa]|uniref:alpha-(1,3)-fucosyltransferase C-like n=1 Tax=Hyposmocoma kahamanoa TaxID=1477025 RepID=UPI000E6D9ED5|nr:alpha-(1,3)-fucosyltransferase C-like [Hyposmocoma kahamanoa]